MADTSTSSAAQDAVGIRSSDMAQVQKTETVWWTDAVGFRCPDGFGVQHCK
jgi:hypothetical protein